MGLLTSLFSQLEDRTPSSDYWYLPIGSATKSGVRIDEHEVMRISAVLQGVRFISQTTAQLPRFIYRHLEDGRSREKDMTHPLNRFLRFQPNPWQTAFQFVELLTAHAMLKGIGIAERVHDEVSGELQALIPVDPNRLIRVEQLSTGRLRFVFRTRDGGERALLQEEVFWLSGFGIEAEGVRGLQLAQQMRETAGLAIATEEYGSSFFGNSAMPRVVLTNPHPVTKETRERMRADWNRSYSKDGMHGTALLEDGTKVDVLSTKNDEAQFIETRKFLIAEFSRHLDVTPHRLSDLEKSSFNNVEQMSLETVVYSLTPWVKRWEQSWYRDLLTEDEKARGYFIEFSLDGLLRGDTEARAKFYQSGVNTGWLTRNEVRAKENLNPIDGLDEPLQAVNQIPVSQADRLGQNTPEPRERDRGDAEPAGLPTRRAASLAFGAAERVVRAEQKRIEMWSGRKVERATWEKLVRGFYKNHVNLVTSALAMDRSRAERWCESQCEQVLNAEPDWNDSVLRLAVEALKE